MVYAFPDTPSPTTSQQSVDPIQLQKTLDDLHRTLLKPENIKKLDAIDPTLRSAFQKEVNDISKGFLAKADGIQSAITTIETGKNPLEVNTAIKNAKNQYAFLREEYITLEDTIKLESGVTHSLTVDRMKVNHYQLEKVKAELKALEQIRASVPLANIRKERFSILKEANVRVMGIKRNINNKFNPLPATPKLVNPMERLRNKVSRQKIDARDLGEKRFFRIGPDGLPIEEDVLNHAVRAKLNQTSPKELAERLRPPRLFPENITREAKPIPFGIPSTALINTESAKILSFAKGAGKIAGAVGVVTIAYDIAVENNAEYTLTKYMESMKECHTSQSPSVFTAVWGRIKQAGVTIGVNTGMDDIAALLSDGIMKGNFNEDVKKELRNGIGYIKKNCPEVFTTLKTDTRFIDGLNDMDVRTTANPLVLEIRQAPLNWWQNMIMPHSIPQYHQPYDIRPFEGVSMP